MDLLLSPVALVRASRIDASERSSADPRWCFDELRGRLIEIAGWRRGATFTFALELVLDAQRAREPVAWVGPRSRTFLPSDASACGVDLNALPLVRVRDAREIAIAADILGRSGAFGLIVLDLGVESMALGTLSRLAGLARAHESTIAVLTEKEPERASLGSFVSLRADTSFRSRGAGLYACEIAVARDRRRAIRWNRSEVRRGPPGLP